MKILLQIATIQEEIKCLFYDNIIYISILAAIFVVLLLLLIKRSSKPKFYGGVGRGKERISPFPFEQTYGKRSDKEVQDIINSTQFYGRSENDVI